MTLKGTIVHVIYKSEKDFAVVVVQQDNGIKQTFAGKIYQPQVGMEIIAEGEIVNHPTYKTQFKVKSSELKLPKTKMEIINYIRGNLPKKCELLLAEKIVQRFGLTVIEDIIENDPLRLMEIPGIDRKTAQYIAKSHQENCVFQFLVAAGLSMAVANKLYSEYGKGAIDVLKATPYKPIYQVEGISFKQLDKYALAHGFAKTDPSRIAAATTYVLLKIGNEGHCWSHIDSVGDLVHEVLPEISDNLIAEQIKSELLKGNLVLEKDRIYAKEMYDAEQIVASSIVKMVKSTDNLSNTNALPLTKRQIVRAIEDTEFQNGIEMDVFQKNAIVNALTNRISVITGGPGSGKTTILSAIVAGWMKQYHPTDKPEDHIILCAPTGKAARRMAEVTGIHADTVHRSIFATGVDPTEEPKLIIVDEASMLDIRLARRIMAYAVKGHFLTLVGDVDQLPPIGPGHFFRDCVQSAFIPSVKLNISHRQSGQIAINAKRINDGEGFYALNLSDPSFRFVYAEKDTAQKAVVREYLALLEKGYSEKEVCCIVPVRKAGKSQTSAEDLNRIIREIVNPAKTKEEENAKWRVGDRVMNTENDHSRFVFNGDCGEIIEVDTEAKNIVVKMDSGAEVVFDHGRDDNLVFAYAMSVHRAQGSEFMAVVVAHNREHSYMLQRNLLYTAVTRARQELVLVGEPKAIDMAVSRIPSLERNTQLRERIKTFMFKTAP